MKNTNYVVSLFALLIMIITSVIKPMAVAAQDKKEELQWLQHWFSAWELVSKETLLLPSGQAPLMVFFDKEFVYTTSPVTAPQGKAINGPALSGEKLSWRKAAHNGELVLPSGQKIPVGLMTFAAPLKEETNKSFFVMAAPPFWKEAGVESAELGLDKLLTGVFLHEFAHTRQMEGFGARVDEVDNSFKFDMPLSDDIVQDHFKKDSMYTRLFLKETNKFYEAAMAKNSRSSEILTAEGLALLKKRQAKYFTGKKELLKELDNIFLSMEGLGQYVAVAWLIHPKGANLPVNIAVKGFRRTRSQWSQEEGLALFLILAKLTKPGWSEAMFGKHPKHIIELLEQAVSTNK